MAELFMAISLFCETTIIFDPRLHAPSQINRERSYCVKRLSQCFANKRFDTNTLITCLNSTAER